MISRRVLTILVATGVLLPVVFVVIGGVARLLSAMGDASVALVGERIALAVAVIWAVDLACLILALGINAIGPPDGSA